MRREQVTAVVVWGTCSGLASGVLVYLGANTAPYQARWPLATVTGAAVGVAGALLVLRLLGSRRGVLLIGLLFGVLQALISAKVLWGLK
jgi:hypothetical protein